MLGRNNSRPQAAFVSEESSARSKSDSGRLLTMVGAAKELRPAHVAEGALAATTRR